MADNKHDDNKPTVVPLRESIKHSEHPTFPNSQTRDNAVTNTRPAPPNPNRNDSDSKQDG